MPISVRWYDDTQRIIYQQYGKIWNWEEFYHSNMQDVAGLMNSVSHRVDLISDMRDTRMIPIGNSMTNANTVLESYPPNWGILVIVVDNLFIRTMVDMYKRVFQNNVSARTFAVASLEESLALIASRNPQDL